MALKELCGVAHNLADHPKGGNTKEASFPLAYSDRQNPLTWIPLVAFCLLAYACKMLPC